MLLNKLICNMALLLFVLMASVATMAVDITTAGSKTRIQPLVGAVTLTSLKLVDSTATPLSPRSQAVMEPLVPLTAPALLTSVLRYAVVMHHLDSTLLTTLQLMAIANSCAKNEPDQLDHVMDSLPCLKALIADAIATSVDLGSGNVKGTTFDTHLSGSDRTMLATQSSRRATPARDARLKRRAIVAGLIAEGDTERLKADGNTASASQDLPGAQGEADAELSFTPVIKRASLLSRGEPSQRPKWQPTTCTAPGVTCANDGNDGSASKLEVRSESGSETESLLSRLAERSPKLPSWFPLLCTSFGITCAESGTSGDASDGDNTSQPSDTVTKREAHHLAKRSPKLPSWFPLLCTTFGITCAESGTSDGANNGGDTNQPPVAVVKREANKHPKWVPTSCTARGITCGDPDGSEEGAAGTGIDGVSSTTSQSGTGGQNKQRDPDAATAHVWSDRPSEGIFTDDEGNIVQIEDGMAFAA